MICFSALKNEKKMREKKKISTTGPYLLWMMAQGGKERFSSALGRHPDAA
jgi:hypothetical protein